MTKHRRHAGARVYSSGPSLPTTTTPKTMPEDVAQMPYYYEVETFDPDSKPIARLVRNVLKHEALRVEFRIYLVLTLFLAILFNLAFAVLAFIEVFGSRAAQTLAAVTSYTGFGTFIILIMYTLMDLIIPFIYGAEIFDVRSVANLKKVYTIRVMLPLLFLINVTVKWLAYVGTTTENREDLSHPDSRIHGGAALISFAATALSTHLIVDNLYGYVGRVTSLRSPVRIPTITYSDRTSPIVSERSVLGVHVDPHHRENAYVISTSQHFIDPNDPRTRHILDYVERLKHEFRIQQQLSPISTDVEAMHAAPATSKKDR